MSVFTVIRRRTRTGAPPMLVPGCVALTTQAMTRQRGMPYTSLVTPMVDGDRMQMQAMPLARSKVVAEAIVALHKALQTLSQNVQKRYSRHRLPTKLRSSGHVASAMSWSRVRSIEDLDWQVLLFLCRPHAFRELAGRLCCLVACAPPHAQSPLPPPAPHVPLSPPSHRPIARFAPAEPHVRYLFGTMRSAPAPPVRASVSPLSIQCAL